MFERYTEKARRVIFFSRYEAGLFGEGAIETQHLLLGWLREEKRLAARLFGSQGDVQSFRAQIESRIEHQGPTPSSVDLPLSVDSRQVLMNAAEESDLLKHKQIGTHHLLLGMLREEECLAAQLLGERGLKLSEVREEIRRLSPNADGELEAPAGE